MRDGNARRIRITKEEGEQLIEIPLSVGVVGIFLLSAWVAIGAIAAVVQRLDLGAGEGDSRVGLYVEEVRAAKMIPKLRRKASMAFAVWLSRCGSPRQQ